MKFRIHQIGIVADIEKVILQIGLQETERDVTRFIWLKDTERPDVTPQNVQEFPFCRIPFGVISSPFLLGATNDYYLDTYDSGIAKQLKSDIYMDSVITGATELYQDSKIILSEAKMNLRDMASFNDQVMSTIPSEDSAEGETECFRPNLEHKVRQNWVEANQKIKG